MRPFDCKSYVDEVKLNEQGIAHNGDGIILSGGRVIWTVGQCTLTIPGSLMRLVTEWYFEDQDTKED